MTQISLFANVITLQYFPMHGMYAYTYIYTHIHSYHIVGFVARILILLLRKFATLKSVIIFIVTFYDLYGIDLMSFCRQFMHVCLMKC